MRHIDEIRSEYHWAISARKPGEPLFDAEWRWLQDVRVLLDEIDRLRAIVDGGEQSLDPRTRT